MNVSYLNNISKRRESQPEPKFLMPPFMEEEQIIESLAGYLVNPNPVSKWLHRNGGKLLTVDVSLDNNVLTYIWGPYGPKFASIPTNVMEDSGVLTCRTGILVGERAYRFIPLAEFRPEYSDSILEQILASPEFTALANEVEQEQGIVDIFKEVVPSSNPTNSQTLTF